MKLNHNTERNNDVIELVLAAIVYIWVIYKFVEILQH
jgi:hypothetical protein